MTHSLTCDNCQEYMKYKHLRLSFKGNGKKDLDFCCYACLKQYVEFKLDKKIDDK